MTHGWGQTPVVNKITYLCLGHISCWFHTVAIRFCGLQFANVIFLNRRVLQVVLAVVTNGTATAQRLYDSSKTVRWPHGDQEAAAQRRYDTLTVVAATTCSPCSHRKDAVRPPYDFLGTQDGKNRKPPHGHCKAAVRWPCDALAMWLRRCGFWKKV